MPTNFQPHPKGRCDKCAVTLAIERGEMAGARYEDMPCARCVGRHRPHDIDLYREINVVDYTKADACGALVVGGGGEGIEEPRVDTVDLATPTGSMVEFFAEAMALPDDARELVVFVMRHRGRGAFSAWARERGVSREYARKLYRGAQDKVPALAMIYRRHQRAK